MEEKNETGLTSSVQELPTEPGAVIVPADGHEYIEANLYGMNLRAREAVLCWVEIWYAAWRDGASTHGNVKPEHITPGTWKVDDQ